MKKIQELENKLIESDAKNLKLDQIVRHLYSQLEKHPKVPKEKSKASSLFSDEKDLSIISYNSSNHTHRSNSVSIDIKKLITKQNHLRTQRRNSAFSDMSLD